MLSTGKGIAADITTSLAATFATVRASWRAGCKLRHIWGRAEELEQKLGHTEPYLKQCRRCFIIRGV